MKHLDLWHGLDADLKQSLIKQLRNLWTHTSTALEGNTLSLGETAFVLEEGLTVGGKPLKDHEEVVGHARAIDLIWSYIARENGITKEDLFALHKAVQTERIMDIYQPVGNWKVEHNGTIAITDDGRQVFLEYAAPEAVSVLMDDWLEVLNGFLKENLDREPAVMAYAELHTSWVRIHPFGDGNGRMARLVANLPVIHSGWPPIIIPVEKRREYIRLLSRYELAVGIPKVGEPLLPNKEQLIEFIRFCDDSWQQSLELVKTARKTQSARNEQRKST
jgi:Fic family protein